MPCTLAQEYSEVSIQLHIQIHDLQCNKKMCGDFGVLLEVFGDLLESPLPPFITHAHTPNNGNMSMNI